VTVKVYRSLCGGRNEGQVVKVAVYSKPFPTDPDRFFRGQIEPSNLACPAVGWRRQRRPRIGSATAAEYTSGRITSA
jgi:hypothetical protein